MTGRSVSALHEPAREPDPGREPLRIWGGVPLRNPAFTGRESLLLTLQRALERRAKASVLPHALHGMGGVGKTALAVEFAYRYADRYDLVWWIPAEHQSLVLQSLYQLGRHFDTPDTADLQQAANLVLEKLAGSDLRWLLIYDNANEPEDIARLMPSGGGHVILTSRNPTWSDVWDPIEVDVFDRPESIELVRKRSETVSAEDADRLADRLGDLPLALDQAASCQAVTGMPVGEYLSELEQHVRELSGTRPPTYRTTIAALVRLALRRLRSDAPAVAELLEMFAYLGAEPISGGLLRRGRDARVSPALGQALRDEVAWRRATRELRRYGLAKVDADQRIQVHRLFQGVLRDELTEEAAQRGRANVQHLLASANPGDPGDMATWPVHRDIGPHVLPAGLMEAELLDARRVVLDQIRFLYLSGDLEGSQRLGEAAVAAWSKVESTPGLGPNGELTLTAKRRLATALRSLGFNDRARVLSEETLRLLLESPEFGPDHEHTLLTADEVAPNLRIAGLFREALDLDGDNLERHRRRYGDEDDETLKARQNLAVNLRMLSDFAGAHDIDTAVVRTWQQMVSENDNRLLFAQTNLARDLYGLGRYDEALEILQRVLPPYRQQLGPQHPHVLLAGRTLAITLRKVGRYTDALTVAADHHRDSESRYRPEHEHALAAAMTYANTLRVTGELESAEAIATESIDRYLRLFGETHPLSLSAAVNHAIILRGLGEWARARELGERTYAQMTGTLGAGHGYTLSAANNHANDLALAGETEAARRLSAQTFEISREARGGRHPYTLWCGVNAALDAIVAGETEYGEALRDETLAALAGVLGADHPEVIAAGEGRRVECDLEPPPT
ncbi:FxSxx-COOH system tetratricopeptide repeat protein [Phytohabitans kaempferiae]|uniref:FxSxx-COOH system tetratricopeptide repeat protein n=1 Tax=Phytohabitans kaempferiae TaxID=1620943 RepID=A0ABV6M355_9ACTN